jgi:phosphatidate cytidylyltransferase
MEKVENSGSLSKRIITGIALIAGVAGVGYIDNFYLTWLVLGVTYLFAFYEANALFGLERNSLFFYAALIWLSALVYPYGDDLLVLAGVLFFGVVAYTRNTPWKNFLPFLYPTAGMLYFWTLYQEYAMTSLMWLVAAVALTDIGAFVVGKTIGRTPFSPTSPKKTWEGVIGGVVIATAGSFWIGVETVGIPVAVAVSFFVSFASVFGDLFESYLKRQAGVKDSGHVLPGHGGVLDRIDGYLFGSVVMLILLRGLVSI